MSKKSVAYIFSLTLIVAFIFFLSNHFFGNLKETNIVENNEDILSTKDGQLSNREKKAPKENFDQKPMKSFLDQSKKLELSDLRGQWQGKSDLLIDSDSQSSLKVNITIHDQDGNGTKKITLSDETSCLTNIQARILPDKRISINDVDYPHCTDKTYFIKTTILCDVDKEETCIIDQTGMKKIPIELIKTSNNVISDKKSSK